MFDAPFPVRPKAERRFVAMDWTDVDHDAWSPNPWPAPAPVQSSQPRTNADCITPGVAPANESIRLACRSLPYTPPTNERTSANCASRRSGFAIAQPQPVSRGNVYGVAANRG